MSSVESHVREEFGSGEPMRPLEIPAANVPVLATPALGYGALTFAAFMAGNVVTDFVGDESPTGGSADDLHGRSAAELLSLRTSRLSRP